MRRLNHDTSRMISHAPSVPNRSSRAVSVSSPTEKRSVISSAAAQTRLPSALSRSTGPSDRSAANSASVMRVFVIEPVFDRDSQIHVFAQLRVDLAGMEKLVDQR